MLGHKWVGMRQQLPISSPLRLCPNGPPEGMVPGKTAGRVYSSSKDKGFLEKLSGELLDVATAGPKMRKWYGQQSSLPRDGGGPEPPTEQKPEPQQQQQQQQQQLQQPQEEEGVRDVVLVTDADTPTGELVVLQLILLRANIRILVKDTAAAKMGYGPYVEPVSVDINSAGALARVMKNVRSVVVLGKLGAVLPAAQQAGVQRLVLLSTAGMPQPGGLASLFHNAADAALKEPQREAAILGSNIPHVIVKAGVINDVPGGSSRISITPASAATSSSSSSSAKGQMGISREDLASAVVASAVYLPGLDKGGENSSSAGVVFQVQEAGAGQPPTSEEYQQLLDGLLTANV